MKYSSIVSIAAAALFVASSLTAQSSLVQATAGETITVTTLDDVSDISGAQQVSNLPGTDGLVSFREAVTAANNTAGPQTIAFAIPTSTFWLIPNVAMLRLEQGAFFLTGSGTTIDFSTQTANIGNTNLGGPEAGIYGLEPNGLGSPAIVVLGSNCVIKGLGTVNQRGYAVQIKGNDNRVTGCQIDGPLLAAVQIRGDVGGPIPSGNIIGGTASGEGNSLVGLLIDGPAVSNIVIGNALLVGVQVRGASQPGVYANDNHIGGSGPGEGNVISGAGSYDEEGFPTGNQVSVINAQGTIIEGNLIGTTADGMRAYPQIGPVGVEVRDSGGTTIRNNLIAGLLVSGSGHAAGQIFGQAILVDATNGNTTGTMIQGNTIGLAADGMTPIATHAGIAISPVTSAFHVAGTLISSNHIAFVDTAGILVSSLENSVMITRNSIHDCGGQGIDLGATAGADGPTANDPGDGDSGGNGLQNYPLLQSVVATGSGVEVQGTLDSTRFTQYSIEFFASPSCDPSGFGEGATYLGSTTVTTDGAGQAAFTAALPVSVAAGSRATATATQSSSGNTSEFSSCVAIQTAGNLLARISATPLSGSAPLTVQFSSAGSSDPTGTITSYSWMFGDGAGSTVANPTHTYASGNFTATLTVTDNANSSASDSVAIVSTMVSDTALRSSAIDLSAAVQGRIVTVTGHVAVQNSDGISVSGVVIWATWTGPNGVTEAQAATTNIMGFATFVTAGGPGSYSLTVTNVIGTGYTFDSANSVLWMSITQMVTGRVRASRG